MDSTLKKKEEIKKKKGQDEIPTLQKKVDLGVFKELHVTKGIPFLLKETPILNF